MSRKLCSVNLLINRGSLVLPGLYNLGGLFRADCSIGGADRLEDRLALWCLVCLIMHHIDLTIVWLVVTERCGQYDAVIFMESTTTFW